VKGHTSTSFTMNLNIETNKYIPNPIAKQTSPVVDSNEKVTVSNNDIVNPFEKDDPRSNYA